MNIKSIKKLIHKRKIKFIRLCFLDVLSQPKYLYIPSKRIDSIINQEISFDGSSIKGFASLSNSDLYLKPDLNSFTILEYLDNKLGLTASLMCEVFVDNQIPYTNDSRHLLKKAIAKLKDEYNADFYIGFEPEFYLLDSEIPTDKKGYFDQGDEKKSRCIKTIVQYLEKMNFKIRSFHHEVGSNQFEINYHYATPIEAIDKLILLKEAVLITARRYNLSVDFSPKPFKGLPGNGLHTNCSLFSLDKKNLFYDEQINNLSTLATYFINGILNRCKELSIFSNSSENSYLRLNEGLEAPKYIAYGYCNRSSLIRIPKAMSYSTRIEIRSVDTTASLYSYVSLLIYAGIEGIEKKSTKFKPYEQNLYQLDETEAKNKGIDILPKSLEEAYIIACKSSFLKKHLPANYYSTYLNLKK